MTTVVMLCGVAGAGKTTYARTLEDRGFRRISYDEELWALGYDGRTASAEALAESDRRVRAGIRRSIADHIPVVLDASMSTRAIRDEFREWVLSQGATPRLVVVEAPLELIADRMRSRAGLDDANSLHLDDDALRDYHASFEFPEADEPHERVRSGPSEDAGRGSNAWARADAHGRSCSGRYNPSSSCEPG